MRQGCRRYRMEVEYEGKDFHGWQIQPARRSVQGDLEAAFSSILGEKITILGAGRTDSGVHALGQVAHFDAAGKFDISMLGRKVNGFLEKDVAVRGLRRAAADFHSRGSATGRFYRYHLALRKPPLMRGRSWYTRSALDEEVLRSQTRLLLGEHDFRAFCARSGRHEDTVCRVRLARWRRWESGLLLELEANRFVHHMIRNLVGTLVPIAQGRWPGKGMAELLQLGDRTLAGPTAPARGLCLVKVYYRPRPGAASKGVIP